METAKVGTIRNSYLTLRLIIGILGVALPFILLFANSGPLPSISDSYYTKSAVFFIAILFSIGLFLVAYKGYESRGEKMTDNIITNIGGLAALFVILFPTTCPDNFYCSCLYGHTISWISWVHFASAGIFLTSMGWMSIFQFPKGEHSNWNKGLYIFFGVMVWLSLVVLILGLIGFHLIGSDPGTFVFWMESIAVWFFGISWLIKGHALRSLANLLNMFAGPKTENKDSE